MWQGSTIVSATGLTKRNTIWLDEPFLAQR
jgi:hypothetical protein